MSPKSKMWSSGFEDCWALPTGASPYSRPHPQPHFMRTQSTTPSPNKTNLSAAAECLPARTHSPRRKAATPQNPRAQARTLQQPEPALIQNRYPPQPDPVLAPGAVPTHHLPPQQECRHLAQPHRPKAAHQQAAHRALPELERKPPNPPPQQHRPLLPIPQPTSSQSKLEVQAEL